MKLHLQVREVGEVTIIECHGRIAFRLEAEALTARLSGLLGQKRQFVMDLSGVEMIDSAGLGKLVQALTSVRAQQGALRLASPSRQVRNLLELTNLHTILEVHSSVEDAVLASRAQAA